jgi:hypothetical protein
LFYLLNRIKPEVEFITKTTKNGRISRLETNLWRHSNQPENFFSFDLYTIKMDNVEHFRWKFLFGEMRRRIYWERSVCMMWWSIVIHIKKKKRRKKKPIDDQSLSFVCLCSEWFDLDHDDTNVTKWEKMIHSCETFKSANQRSILFNIKNRNKKKEIFLNYVVE